MFAYKLFQLQRQSVMWCVWPVCCRQDGEAEVQQLVSEMRAEGERHKRELETVRQQCRREVEDGHRRCVNQCKTSQKPRN